MTKVFKASVIVTTITALIFAFSGNTGSVNAQKGMGGMKGKNIIDTVTTLPDYEASHPSLENPTPSLEEMLQFAIEDEFKARAEYEAIISKFGEVRPFTNIIQSEEQHISALIPLYTKRNMAIPEDNMEQYVVIPESLKQACEIGVQAEIDNIAMYEHFLKQDLPADVRQVFTALKSASYNHLDAFQRCASRY